MTLNRESQLIFLFCWTNIFRNFALDVTSIHDTCILVLKHRVQSFGKY